MKQQKKSFKKIYVEERKKAYYALLSLPPLVALAMIGIISFTNKTIVVAPEGMMLSPVKDSAPLIISLIIFIIGYLVFVGFLFREELMHIILRKHHHRH